MARSIFDMVTADAIASYYETLETNRIPFLGEGLFQIGMGFESFKVLRHRFYSVLYFFIWLSITAPVVTLRLPYQADR